MGVDKGKSIPVILDDRTMQFRWLDRVVFPSQQFTLDYVSRKSVVRLQFNTEEGFNHAQGVDLSGVYLCDRFFDKDFTARSRRSLLWSNHDPSTLLKYQDFSGQGLVEKTVELRLWLPHTAAEREGLFAMFKESERYKQIKESPTDLGQLLKRFQEFINDAGWKGETLNSEIRNRDVRGRFAAKYEWVVPCNPPDHLYQINGIAEFEGQDDQPRNAVGLRNVCFFKNHSHNHKKCLMQIKLSEKINSHDDILEQYIKPNLRAPAVAEEKLKLKEDMPGPVVDHVFKLAYAGKPPSITKLQKYVESIRRKVKPEIIYYSRSTVSIWLRKLKIPLVKLGYISAEVGDAFQHKIRDPYNDNIKEKSQKGYGSSGKDYDP
jgi:hypothetical protein